MTRDVCKDFYNRCLDRSMNHPRDTYFDFELARQRMATLTVERKGSSIFDFLPNIHPPHLGSGRLLSQHRMSKQGKSANNRK
jgi:hypothetical protein